MKSSDQRNNAFLIKTLINLQKKLESIKHMADSRIMELKNVLASLENKLEEQRTATMKSIEEYNTASLSANASNTEYMRKLESSITQKLDENSLLQKSLTGFAEENKALYKQIQVFQEEVKDLHEVLSASQTSSKAQLDEVTLLRNQVENYRRNEDLMTQRTKNIVSRYTEGDLVRYIPIWITDIPDSELVIRRKTINRSST